MKFFAPHWRLSCQMIRMGGCRVPFWRRKFKKCSNCWPSFFFAHIPKNLVKNATIPQVFLSILGREISYSVTIPKYLQQYSILERTNTWMLMQKIMSHYLIVNIFILIWPLQFWEIFIPCSDRIEFFSLLSLIKRNDSCTAGLGRIRINNFGFRFVIRITFSKEIRIRDSNPKQ